MKKYAVPFLKNYDHEARLTVKVPGSKSISNRALLLAAMSRGRSVLSGCLFSDDSKYFLKCLVDLGFPIILDEESERVEITGFGGEIPKKEARLYVGSAGTAARFLAAMLAFSDGSYVLESSEQMEKRPMAPLINTLRDAGAQVECLKEEGHFPLRIKGVSSKEDLPSEMSVDVSKSSQFLSALLIAAGTFPKNTRIRLIGAHGLSYVRITTALMEQFGVPVKEEGEGDNISFLVLAEGKGYNSCDYDIEPDVSAAAYFYALAALLGVSVRVSGVKKDSLQGDISFIKVLESMGCRLSEENGDIRLSSSGRLRGGFDIDMSSFSDQALTLAAISPYADAPVTISNIAHIRLQECDRIRAIEENLSRLGVRVDAGEDHVTVYPAESMKSAELESYDDHRVAMAFSLTGLLSEGVVILDPDCCRKTFKDYFSVLDRVIERLIS